MARVTVEDCVLVVPNRFELCLIASNRAKSILSGAQSEHIKVGEKPSVLALREIADGTVEVDKIRNNIISGIRNRNFSYTDSLNSSADKTENEMQNQIEEATFISENLDIED